MENIDMIKLERGARRRAALENGNFARDWNRPTSKIADKRKKNDRKEWKQNVRNQDW